MAEPLEVALSALRKGYPADPCIQSLIMRCAIKTAIWRVQSQIDGVKEHMTWGYKWLVGVYG